MNTKKIIQLSLILALTLVTFWACKTDNAEVIEIPQQLDIEKYEILKTSMINDLNKVSKNFNNDRLFSYNFTLEQSLKGLYPKNNNVDRFLDLIKSRVRKENNTEKQRKRNDDDVYTYTDEEFAFVVEITKSIGAKKNTQELKESLKNIFSKIVVSDLSTESKENLLMKITILETSLDYLTSILRKKRFRKKIWHC